MIKKVIHTIAKYKMLEKYSQVSVGFSGGADSTALMLILCELGYKVRAFHINHGIRGDEAKRDENFCIETAKKLSAEIEVISLDIPSIAKQRGKGIEETARDCRYEIFSRAITVTAHTADDSAETILFNLIRGTGIDGLCGIPPVRKNGENFVVRPLIECTRAEVESFLKHRNQEFMTDSTNLTNDYTRNKIRNEIIPLIREINPSFGRTVKNTANILQSAREFIDSAETPEKLKKAPKIIRLREIERMLKEQNIAVNYGKLSDLDNILTATGSIFDENGKIKC